MLNVVRYDIMNKEKACEICGITNKETNRVSYCSKAGKVLCSKHLAQYLRNGCFLDYTTFDPNNYITHDDYAEIELRNKHGDITGYAKIDLEDVAMCRPFKWHLRKDGYTVTKVSGKDITMHRLVIGYTGDLDINHINRDRLDNRRANLRVVTRSENRVNTKAKSNTGYQCITKTPYGTYQVRIDRNNKRLYQKRHKTIAEAIVARDKALAEYNEEHNRVC